MYRYLSIEIKTATLLSKTLRMHKTFQVGISWAYSGPVYSGHAALRLM